MGSKKHKKESKKKKHRSRSRSPLEGEERTERVEREGRERKRHKKHKDRKKDRSPDVEEVPVNSHIADNGADSRSRSGSVATDQGRDRRSGDRSYDPERDRDRDYDRESAKGRERHAPSPDASTGGGAQETMSIEDTNRLRAKLGLKPLEINEKPSEDGKIKDDLGEFYHKPAANISQQRKAEKLRERLQERKEKRALEQKLQTTLLAEGSDDEDASAWVMKSRVIEKQKKEAAKRAAMLDEMDAAFGVSALVAEEARAERQAAYSHAQLRGLRVAHDLAALADERETVLTLADKEVLAEDSEDVLVNVNIVDDERYKKNIEERKKAKAGYQAYDEEAELQASLGFARPVLAKYDDEIDSGKASRSKGFVIGDQDALEAARFKEMMRQERIAGGPDKRLESLMLPQRRLASDYLDEHELNAKFKKFKKKGKIRKKPKAEPISVEDYDAGNVPLDTDDTEVKPEHLERAAAGAQAEGAQGAGRPEGVEGAEEEEVEPDGELQAALARARRLRQAAISHTAVIPKVEEILEQVKEETHDEEMEDTSTMVLDATAEFCRTLGDIPTYGLAGNRDHAAEIMDFENEEGAADGAAEGEAEGGGAGAGAAGGGGAAGGAWSRVDVARERPGAGGAAGAGGAGAAAEACGGGGLEAEPALGAGVAGALRLALSKGYLERAGAAPAPPPRHTALPAAVYSIEDKTLGGDDDKYGRRERGHGHSGPLTEFREKSQFRPNIKLEYVDDDGRALCPKEAFRYLSHKFHGKGPGKNKQEKRIKKQVQEGLMKKMSSTDTPLGTLHMLQQKQRETHSPYVLLSGPKKDPAP